MSSYDFCRSFCFFFILLINTVTDVTPATTLIPTTINSTDVIINPTNSNSTIVANILAVSNLPPSAAVAGKAIAAATTAKIVNDFITEKYQNENVIIEGTPAGRALFSPKVDYNNKWKPVGHGDPLKKDPTYDYSPPVLDRVRYWGGIGGGGRGNNENDENDNNNNRNSDGNNENENNDSSIETSLLSNGDYYLASTTTISSIANDVDKLKQLKKNDILLLGVSSKQRPPSLFNNKQNAYHKSQHQQQHQQQQQQQLQQSQSTPQQYQQHYNRKTELNKPNYYHSSSYNLATVPLSRRNYYPQQPPVVLMPPPMQTLSPLQLDNNGQQFHIQKQYNWSQKPSSTQQVHQSGLNDDTLAQESMQYSNFVLNPNSNLINFHKQVNNLSTGTSEPMLIMSPSSSSSSNKMNTYRKKPWIHELLQKEEVFKPPQTNMPPTIITPTGSKTIVTMEESPTIYESHAMTYQHHEDGSSAPWKGDASIFTNIVTPTTLLENEYNPYYRQSQMPIETSTYFTPTIPPTILTTSAATVTATAAAAAAATSVYDEIYSHYKQGSQTATTTERPFIGRPTEPSGPPILSKSNYLIIEGHSNVKTYGQNDDDKSKRITAKIVPVQSTIDPIVNRVVSEDETGNRFEVKHLHKKIKNLDEIDVTTTDKTKYSKFKSTSSAASPMNSLLSLLDTSFGDFLNIDQESLDASPTTTDPATITTAAEADENDANLATTITDKEDDKLLLLTTNSTITNLNSNEMIKQDKN